MRLLFLRRIDLLLEFPTRTIWKFQGVEQSSSNQMVGNFLLFSHRDDKDEGLVQGQCSSPKSNSSREDEQFALAKNSIISSLVRARSQVDFASILTTVMQQISDHDKQLTQREDINSSSFVNNEVEDDEMITILAPTLTSMTLS